MPEVIRAEEERLREELSVLHEVWEELVGEEDELQQRIKPWETARAKRKDELERILQLELRPREQRIRSMQQGAREHPSNTNPEFKERLQRVVSAAVVKLEREVEQIRRERVSRWQWFIENLTERIQAVEKHLIPIKQQVDALSNRIDLYENALREYQSVRLKKEAQQEKRDRLLAALAEVEGRQRQLANTVKGRLSRPEACPYCGIPLTEQDELHADHIYPLSRGGRSTFENMVYVCASCNLGKGDSTVSEFVERRGFDWERVKQVLRGLGKRL